MVALASWFSAGERLARGGWALGLTWGLLLEPLAIGPGFEPRAVPAEELAADGFEASTLEAQAAAD